MKVFDADGNEYNKETVDARECVEQLGWTYEKPEPKQESDANQELEKDSNKPKSSK